MFQVGDTVWFNKGGIWDEERSEYVGTVLERHRAHFYDIYVIQLLPEFRKTALTEMHNVHTFNKETLTLSVAEDWLSFCESVTVSIDVSDFL